MVQDFLMCSVSRLNKKMSSYQYRDPYVKDKMVSLQSYLQHGNPHTWKIGLYIEMGPGTSN